VAVATGKVAQVLFEAAIEDLLDRLSTVFVERSPFVQKRVVGDLLSEGLLEVYCAWGWRASS
jgi:hypothetical protein